MGRGRAGDYGVVHDGVAGGGAVAAGDGRESAGGQCCAAHGHCNVDPVGDSDDGRGVQRVRAVRAVDRMRSTMRTRRGAVMAAAAILAGSRVLASVSSGQLLTNFASATFNLPSGGAAGDVDTGTNNFGVQNS